LKSNRLTRWIKYILVATAAAVALLAVFVAAALIVLDDDDYRALAIRGVQALTGCRMVVGGPFVIDLSSEPSLTAGGIRIAPATAGSSSQPITIGRLQVKIALKPLLSGILLFKHLRLEDVTVENVAFQAQNQTDSKVTNMVPEFIMPVFESVSLANLKVAAVDRDSGHKTRYVLNRLIIDDIRNQGPLLVNGNGLIDETGFSIQGRMGTVAGLRDFQEPFPLDIRLQLADLILTVSGTFGRGRGGPNLDFVVTAAEPELANLLQTVQPDIPALGRLKLKARISGSLKAPGLSELDLLVSDGSSSEFSARGAIADLASGAGTAIELAGRCENRTMLAWIFPASWQVVEKFKFNAVLRHLPSGYWIEDIEALVANDRHVTFAARGRLQMDSLSKTVPIKQVDLRLHLASSRTDAIRPLLTNSLPEIGSVDARGHLIGPLDHLALEELRIIRGGSGPVRVETHGRIGWIPVTDDEHLSGMDFTISIRADRSKALSTFYGVPIEEIGAVSIITQVMGDSNRFELKDLEFRSKDKHGLESRMIGGIDFARQADGKMLGRMTFKLDIKAPNMGAATPLLGANLVPEFGPVHAEALVTGNTDVLAFEKIGITAGQPGKVLIKWRGRIDTFPLGGERPVSDVHTYGTLEAARTSDFAAMLFGVAVPDFGPVKASWREIDRSGIYGVDDIKFVAGDGRKFRLSATGRIGSLFQQKKAYIDGVDLKLSLKTSDTDGLFRLIGVHLPDLGAADGRMALSGGQDKLAAENLHLTIKSKKGLEIVATGGAGYIGLSQDLPVQDIDVRLEAKAPDTGAIAGIGPFALPDLGEFHATARLGEREGVLGIQAFELRGGPEHKPAVQVHGRIDHVGDPEKMSLAADFEVDTEPWFEKMSIPTPAAPPQIKGRLNLAGAADHIRIDSINLTTDQLGGADMQAEGRLKPGAGYPELDVRLKSSFEEPAAWGKLLDLSLPPLSSVTVDGHYASRGAHYRFEGDAHVGNTRLQTDFSHTHDAKMPHTNIKVSSDIVHLKDFGLFPRGTRTSPVAATATAEPSQQALFSDEPLALDVMKSRSFSFNFSADKVAGQDVVLNRLNFDAELKNGQLRIGSFETGYEHGKLSGEAVFDTTGSEAALNLKMTAEDVDIADVLSHLQETPVIEGHLNLVVDMQSRGASNKEIAANLSGEFGLAVENGRIQRGVEMIAADALALLLTTPARKSYTDLNCLAGRLVFENGVGTIQILYLDTPGVRARGAGSVDLGAETVDIVINPLAKRRLFKSSSTIRIQGSLGKPSVKKVPAKEAAILAGQLAAPLIALPGRALGYIFSLMRDDTDEQSPCLKGLINEGG